MFGFCWGIVNIGIFWIYFSSDAGFGSTSNRRISATRWLFNVVIVLPIAAVMCLGPFFSPFAGLSLAQKVCLGETLFFLSYLLLLGLSRRLGRMGVITSQSKSYSVPRPTMVPVRSPTTPNTSWEMSPYTHTIYSSNPPTIGLLIFALSTPPLSPTTSLTLSIPQSPISHTTSSITRYLRTALRQTRTPLPNVSTVLSTPTIIYLSRSVIYGIIRPPT